MPLGEKINYGCVALGSASIVVIVLLYVYWGHVTQQ